MEAISSVAIIGTGNVAFHLGSALFEQGIRISGIYGRNVVESQVLSKQWNSEMISDLSILEAELALICISDDAVPEIASVIPKHVKVAYTSGAVPIQSIVERSEKGVFYPLQTFSKGKSIDMFEVPFLIEADNEIFAQQLFDLAWKISRHVVFADSATRRLYHLAAVWVNNFTNHMAFQANEILDKHNLEFKLLVPLLKETADKLTSLDPYSAQTGPARRGDLETIRKHEQLMKGLQRELYSMITQSIIETYKNDQL